MGDNGHPLFLSLIFKITLSDNFRNFSSDQYNQAEVVVN